MKDETVFITGKITGDPNYREKFNKAQKELEEEGYIVLNPEKSALGFEYEGIYAYDNSYGNGRNVMLPIGQRGQELKF